MEILCLTIKIIPIEGKKVVDNYCVEKSLEKKNPGKKGENKRQRGGEGGKNIF